MAGAKLIEHLKAYLLAVGWKVDTTSGIKHGRWRNPGIHPGWHDINGAIYMQMKKEDTL